MRKKSGKDTRVLDVLATRANLKSRLIELSAMTQGEELEPADLENRKTFEGHHNDRPLREILSEFLTARQALVTQLEAADQADWLRSAIHPRLKTSMRLLDLAFFVAEHDDHHLATISELLRSTP